MWGKGQRGKGVPHLLVSSALFNGLSDSPVKLGASPTTATQAVAHSHLWVPLSQPFPEACRAPQPAPPPMSAGHCRFSVSASPVHRLRYLVVLVDFFFNSLVVGVPQFDFLALLVGCWFQIGCPPLGCARKQRVSTYASILAGTHFVS